MRAGLLLASVITFVAGCETPLVETLANVLYTQLEPQISVYMFSLLQEVIL